MFKVRYKITVIFQENKFIKIKAKYIKKTKDVYLIIICVETHLNQRKWSLSKGFTLFLSSQDISDLKLLIKEPQ